MFTGINAIEFNKRFNTNDACFEYLVEHKWGNGFICKRCGNTQYGKGRTSHHKRCQRCRYDESVTAHTLFHSMKMPILKAFYIVFRVTAKKKGMSTVELGCEVSVQQKTAWLFKRKIQIGMKQDHHYKLKGQADIDRSCMGLHITRLRGRNDRMPRMAMVVAAELSPGPKQDQLVIHEVGNFKALRKCFSMTAMSSATPLKEPDNRPVYNTLRSVAALSEIKMEGTSQLKIRHRHLMFFKNWVVGIHHRWSKNHLYAYADEYVFRLNNRHRRTQLFNLLVDELMSQFPHPLPVIKRLCGHST